MPARTPEEQLLVRRVQDAARSLQNGYGRRFLGFLDERGRSLAEAGLNREQAEGTFWGGYEGAQRVLLGLSGDGPIPPADFPLAAVKITCSRAEGLTHRDYLGALLGLGLRRECLGDILSANDTAVCFAERKMADVLCGQLVSVGRFAARAEPAAEADLAGLMPKTETLTINVPSLRADAVLAALLHLSRADSGALIESGALLICHVPSLAPHTAVEEGDTLSVRGYGRFRIVQLGGLSKKGRLWITAEKFTG